MSITIAHQPSPGIVGAAALKAGQLERQERDVDRAEKAATERRRLKMEYDRLLAQIATRDQENQLRARAAQQRTMAGLQEAEAGRAFEMERMERQAELAQQTHGYKLTAEQKARQRQIQQGILWVRQNTGPGGRFSPKQAQALEWQMAQELLGVTRPIPQVEEGQQWPQGQGDGDVWIDERTGAQMTRVDGEAKTQVEYPNTKEGMREKFRVDHQKEQATKQLKEEAAWQARQQKFYDKLFAAEQARWLMESKAEQDRITKLETTAAERDEESGEKTSAAKDAQGEVDRLRFQGSKVQEINLQSIEARANALAGQRPGAGGGQQWTEAQQREAEYQWSVTAPGQLFTDPRTGHTWMKPYS